MSDPFERAVERERAVRLGRRCEGKWTGFLVHLRVYLTVNAVLAAVWAVEAIVDGGHPLWFVEVLWGWGIGLAVHYLLVVQVTRRWSPPHRGS